MKQQLVGWGLIVSAVALMLYNVSDTITDLQTWHSVSTPQFVGAVLKQIASVLLGAVGGATLPAQFGTDK